MRPSRPTLPAIVQIAALTFALALAGAVPSAAGAWTARLSAAWASPDSALFTDPEDGVTTFELDDGFGVVFAVEYGVTDRLGIEIAGGYAEIDGTLSVAGAVPETASATDALSVSPLTLGLVFHPLDDAPVDLSVGAFAGRVFYGDLDLVLLGERLAIDVDDDSTWGVSLGLDVPLGSAGSAVAFGARYLDTDAEQSGGQARIGVDPIVVTVGYAHRF